MQKAVNNGFSLKPPPCVVVSFVSEIGHKRTKETLKNSEFQKIKNLKFREQNHNRA